MATEVQEHHEQSVASLLGGIVNDFQDLLKQQLRLTREEIETELRKSKAPLSLFAAGGVIFLIAAFAFCLMLAHLLHWLGVPLWASFAIVGTLFLILGGVISMMGKNKMEAIGTPLHETAQALKENIEWKTNTRPS